MIHASPNDPNAIPHAMVEFDAPKRKLGQKRGAKLVRAIPNAPTVFSFDPQTGIITGPSGVVALSPTERDMFKRIIDHAPDVVCSELKLPAKIRVHIYHIRGKLASIGLPDAWIRTHRLAGLSWQGPHANPSPIARITAAVCAHRETRNDAVLYAAVQDILGEVL